MTKKIAKKKISKKKVSKKKDINKDKGAKVENEDAIRDINSGAIVFNNQSAYQQHVRRKRQLVSNNKNNTEIRSLQKQVAKLSSLVEQLISTNNNT